jgi:hypothetical protein
MAANNFNAVYRSCFRVAIFSGVRCGTEDCRPLQAAANCLRPEGLPLDQGVSVNCGMRVEMKGSHERASKAGSSRAQTGYILVRGEKVRAPGAKKHGRKPKRL